LFIDDPLDLRIQEFELKVGDHGPAAAKARDDPGIFEGIAEQPDDANEWGVKGEIAPGWVIAVRCSEPASRVITGDCAQKLRAKVTRGKSASAVSGRMNES